VADSDRAAAPRASDAEISRLDRPAPAGVNYRFELVYASEELRQQWINSAIHKKLWPMMEGTLKSKDYGILLFDSV